MAEVLDNKKSLLLSGFHKALRAGDVKQGSYYAINIRNAMGPWKVIQYMYMVCFEETLSVRLFKKLNSYIERKNYNLSDDEIAELVQEFCLTMKKWEIAEGHRFYYNHYLADKKVKSEKREYKVDEELYYKWWERLIGTVSCRKGGKKLKETGLYNPAEYFALVEQSVIDKDPVKLIYSLLLMFDNGHNKAKIDFTILEEIIDNKEFIELLRVVEDCNYNYLSDFTVAMLAMLAINIVKGNNDTYKVDYVKMEKERKQGVRDGKVEQYGVASYILDHHTEEGIKLLKTYGVKINEKMVADMRLSGCWLGVFWRCRAFKQGGKGIFNNWEDVECKGAFFEELVEELENKIK